VLSHNHPGNTARALVADIEATNEIVRRLNAADIIVNDHIIVAGQKAISFAESGIHMGDKSSYFRVSETAISSQKQAAKKPSVHEQIKEGRKEIAQKYKKPVKAVNMAKKSPGLDV